MLPVAVFPRLPQSTSLLSAGRTIFEAKSKATGELSATTTLPSDCTAAARPTSWLAEPSARSRTSEPAVAKVVSSGFDVAAWADEKPASDTAEMAPAAAAARARTKRLDVRVERFTGVPFVLGPRRSPPLVSLPPWPLGLLPRT